MFYADDSDSLSNRIGILPIAFCFCCVAAMLIQLLVVWFAENLTYLPVVGP